MDLQQIDVNHTLTRGIVMSKRLSWLLKQVEEQRAWIAKCGGNLLGYIAAYGDPDIPPLDENGHPKTCVIPSHETELIKRFVPVPNVPDTFFIPHRGNGGTAIFEADSRQLEIWEQELTKLQNYNGYRNNV